MFSAHSLFSSNLQALLTLKFDLNAIWWPVCWRWGIARIKDLEHELYSDAQTAGVDIDIALGPVFPRVSRRRLFSDSGILLRDVDIVTPAQVV